MPITDNDYTKPQPKKTAATGFTPKASTGNKPVNTSGLSVPEASQKIASSSLTTQHKTAEQQAVKESQVYLNTYVETKHKLVPMMADVMKRADQELHNAIAGAAVEIRSEEDETSFLEAFASGLTSGAGALFMPSDSTDTDIS